MESSSLVRPAKLKKEKSEFTYCAASIPAMSSVNSRHRSDCFGSSSWRRAGCRGGGSQLVLFGRAEFVRFIECKEDEDEVGLSLPGRRL